MLKLLKWLHKIQTTLNKLNIEGNIERRKFLAQPQQNPRVVCKLGEGNAGNSSHEEVKVIVTLSSGRVLTLIKKIIIIGWNWEECYY